MKIQHPDKHDHVLFMNEGIRPSENTYYLAKNQKDADELGNKMWPTRPALYTDLLKKMNHSQLTAFFKNFGSAWICFDGYMYYRNPNKSKFLITSEEVK